MIYKFKANFQNIYGDTSGMSYRDCCDCGCQDFKGIINDGDILISDGGHLLLRGNIQNIMIVALSFSTHRSENTIMNNVRFASYTKEYEDELYKHYGIEKPNIRD